MAPAAVLALCLSGLSMAAAGRRPKPFEEAEFGRSCAGGECEKDGSTCIVEPRGVCKFSGGRCPDEICVPPYKANKCAHGACPTGDKCRLDGRGEPVCAGSRCVTPDGDGCIADEVCVREHKGHGAYVCAKVMNMHAGRFDGRTSGVFKRCSSNADCARWGPPVEWFCCTAATSGPFGHKMTTKPGRAKCDTRVRACVAERYEFGKLRWALAQRRRRRRGKHGRYCDRACPCCAGQARAVNGGGGGLAPSRRRLEALTVK